MCISLQYNTNFSLASCYIRSRIATAQVFLGPCGVRIKLDQYKNTLEIGLAFKFLNIYSHYL